jgi:hypothetical protein
VAATVTLRMLNSPKQRGKTRHYFSHKRGEGQKLPMPSVAKRTIRARKMPHFPAVVNGFFLFLIIVLAHAKS